MADDDQLVHATAVAVGDRVALLRGAPGAGKSDLALRMIGLGPSPILQQPIRLVADDYVRLARNASRIIAHAPATIAGKLEVRGLGIIDLDYVTDGEVRLLVDLCTSDAIERLPDPQPEGMLLGLPLPLLRLAPFEASAALKVVAALVKLG